MKRLLLIIGLCATMVGNVFAQNQTTKFSPDPYKFIDELKFFFSKSDANYESGKLLLKEFEPFWHGGSFTEEQQQKIYELTNQMVARRARNFPHIFNYINALLVFCQNEMTQQGNYKEWCDGLNTIVYDKSMKLNDIDKYVVSIIYMLRDKAIYQQGSMRWVSSNSHFEINKINDTVCYYFNSLDLKCIVRKDSIVIYDTKGIYNPISNRWKGGQATVYWENAGISRDTSWAEIDSYSILLNKSSYSIKNVIFYHLGYFGYPLEGTLTDKVMETNKSGKSSYPQFRSNEKTFDIEGLFTDINYNGGFTIMGDKVAGTGTSAEPATVSIFRDVEYVNEQGDTLLRKQLFLEVKSEYFGIRKNAITSANAKIRMNIGNDSIYHPGLQFKYADANREISLIRDNSPENLSRSPYYDSYHNMEMNFGLLSWKMDDSKIYFTNILGSSISTATFESENYFSAERYYEDQGLEDVHPYLLLRSYARKYGTDVFDADEFSRHIRMSLTVTKRLLIGLTYKGIVDYDTKTEICRIKPKLYRYLDCIVEKIDYDLIRFESQTTMGATNAVLNLKNMDLAIQGVPVVNVSERQNVMFYPKNEEILVKKDMSFDFGGRIDAGLFTFHGTNFNFNYNDFMVELNHVDSLNIRVKAGWDEQGRQLLANVQSTIESITGKLKIDEPDNKSGRKNLLQYPIFASEKDSYVYYDDPDIQDGKYTRDTFYFQVYPYVIDSLNSFSTEGMGFDGELHSADIFPVIKQKLVLQEDNSLGFVEQTPNNGYPVYRGTGRFNNSLWLSNMGLRGNGEIDYSDARMMSNDFIFFPDSTNGVTSALNIAEQKGVHTDVIGTKVYAHWEPYKDVLAMKDLGQPLRMYDGEVAFSGKLNYHSKSMDGGGKVELYDARLTAARFDFKHTTFNSQNAKFELNSALSDNLALSTEDVGVDVNMTTKLATFKSNFGNGRVDLPENLYAAWIEQFSWKMAEKKLQFASSGATQQFVNGHVRRVEPNAAKDVPKGSLFLSVHKGQDSLNWVSPVADFDLKTNVIAAHKVDLVAVADAHIFPANGEVTVMPMAKLKTLTGAKLLANTETKYHNFKDVSVDIMSRKQYYGHGDYTYTESDGTVEYISFDPIAVDSTGQTYGNGKIRYEEDFSLSPYFSYQGQVKMEARNPLLRFIGSTKMHHGCSIGESWVKFNDEIDPKDVYIPIDDQPMSQSDEFLVSGGMMATDSVHIYPAFLTPRKLYSNVPVATATGYLHYNAKNSAYEISTKERMAQPDSLDNYLCINKNGCAINSDGDINLVANLGRVKLVNKGTTVYDIDADKYTLDMITTLNFFIPAEAMKLISDTIKAIQTLGAASLISDTYTRGVRSILGSAAAKKMFNEQRIFGTLNVIPPELNTTFMFSELHMTWNKKVNCWQSTGELGIANLNGAQLNKKVKGVLEVERKRSGDGLTLYLEITPDLWYFFSYKRGFMQVLSSDKRFNDIIHSIKGGDRKAPAQKGEASYMFMMAENKKKNDFMKHLQGQAVDEDDQIVDEDGNVYVPDDDVEGDEQETESDSENTSESEQTENETDTENAE